MPLSPDLEFLQSFKFYVGWRLRGSPKPGPDLGRFASVFETFLKSIDDSKDKNDPNFKELVDDMNVMIRSDDPDTP